MDCLGRRNCGAFPRDPAPTEGFVDETGVYGGAYGAEDGDVGEGGHGDGALVGRVHVVEGAADEDSADAAEEAEQGAAYDDGNDVLAECEATEHDGEEEVGADRDDAPAGEFAFAEGSLEERS